MKSLYKTILCATLLVISACGNKEEAKEVEGHEEEANTVEFTPAQYKTAQIQTGSIEHKQLSKTISVSGVLDVPPQNLVSISVPLGGFLKSTELLEGSKVHKGQVIAVIENMEYIQLQQDYLDNSSQLDYLEAEYKRQVELSKNNVTAVKTMQKAKSDYESTKSKVNGLKTKLLLLHISPANALKGEFTSTVTLTSPISGYVTQINANIGSYINPTDVVVKIVDTEHLHVELTVFEKDVPKLKIGQKVRFTLANETTERTATVYLIGREISSERTVRVHCHLDKEDTELIPGMYLKAFIETGANDAIALPDKAIVGFEGKKYIFIEAAQYHFTMVEVTTGVGELGYTEVTLPKDFDMNSKVVINGAYSLLSKLKNAEEEE
ncbi:MAG: efflux RND transporter periplasmic adaptor subunit [Sphingobacteriales bacterium JAD_PAG50586_3]|nr:MAG: efflux RND transporter periplasmic adaptor subunit [Sphingobacteriales bacterium JAD_PAG50586_3]